MKDILCDIKNTNSSGIDDISVRIFKSLPDGALVALVSAINASFQTGIFPECLKTAVVMPLPKGGSLDDPANFRPISLLPTLSKIIEKLVKKRLIGFLSKNNILVDCQFGFQANKSTNDAIFVFLENLYSGLNDGEVAAAVFCDISKAFDCVNHRILLAKLERYGVRGIALNWFSSFLSERRQLVRGKLSDSNMIDIVSGVP